MFDHVMIRVAARTISERFFASVLTPLGIDATRRTDSLVVWQDFMLTEADESHPVTTGLHVAFVAPSPRHVADFWQAGVDAGHRDDGPPGPRPQHGEDYYAAFLRDPSGNSVEAVHGGAARRDGGIIDHVAIRVIDLAAASAFYRTIADSAGFHVLDERPERTTFAAEGRWNLLPDSRRSDRGPPSGVPRQRRGCAALPRKRRGGGIPQQRRAGRAAPIPPGLLRRLRARS